MLLASCAPDEPVRVSGTVDLFPTVPASMYSFVSIEVYANHDPYQAVTLDSVPIPSRWPLAFDVTGRPAYPGTHDFMVRAWLTHEKDTWYLEGVAGETPVTITCTDEDSCEPVHGVDVIMRQ